jgi:hypothetical protein
MMETLSAVDQSDAVRQATIHSVLIDEAARWLRRKCALVITDMAHIGETADAIGWRGTYSILIECKASVSDFKADARKYFRRYPENGMGCTRYFCTMRGLLNPERLPEKWGLLEWDGKKMRETRKPEIHPGNNPRAEISVLISALRRIGANATKGVSVRCYTYHTLDRATLSVACPECEVSTTA